MVSLKLFYQLTVKLIDDYPDKKLNDGKNVLLIALAICHECVLDRHPLNHFQ